jgi:Flp pilus assembly protein TadG
MMRNPGIVTVQIARFANRRDSASGLAAIEFAIIAPILAMLLVCTSDLGLAFYHSMQVEDAAQAGVQYAAFKGFDLSGIETAVTSATTLNINASPAPSESCGCPSGTGVAAATCGSNCADGTMAGTYVTVSAAGSYTTIIPYPLLPPTFPLSAKTTVRIQ